jgi:hypothetical protein
MRTLFFVLGREIKKILVFVSSVLTKWMPFTGQLTDWLTNLLAYLLRGARTRRLLTVFTSARHRSLSWANWIHSTSPQPISLTSKIHSDPILPSTPLSSEWSLSFEPAVYWQVLKFTAWAFQWVVSYILNEAVRVVDHIAHLFPSDCFPCFESNTGLLTLNTHFCFNLIYDCIRVLQ